MVTAREIPPGGEGKIRVSVNTSNRSGNLAKAVTVHSNDKQTPRLRLKVHGKVELLAGFYPRNVSFGTVQQGKKLSRKIKLAGKLASTIKLTKVTSDQPKLLRARLVDGDGVQSLEVTFRASKHDGRFRGMITAATNLARPKQLRLPVWAHVVGDLVPNRQFVLFGTFDPTKRRPPPTAEVRVTSTSGRAFRVLGVKDPSGAVTGKAKRVGKYWEVMLTLTKPPGAGRNEVQIRTNRRDQPKVTVRYSVRAAPVAGRARQIWRRLKQKPTNRPPTPRR